MAGSLDHAAALIVNLADRPYQVARLANPAVLRMRGEKARRGS
jgi:hypothetical protein